MMDAHFRESPVLRGFLPAEGLRILDIREQNAGPIGCNFIQQTALDTATDLPAGTYVGYFEPIHALGITCHVSMVDLATEYEVKNNKLYTLVKSSLLTPAPDPGGGFDITVTDIFNLAAPVTATGNLTVAA